MKKPNRQMMFSVGLLAVVSGLTAMATRPLLAVLAILGGMALSICTGVEMLLLP
ncbi:MAG: hypothetical protein P4M01_11315 [Acidobacteriota bacterium]|nr:hypothetical protein [Acidobacteriota bacterium]